MIKPSTNRLASIGLSFLILGGLSVAFAQSPTNSSAPTAASQPAVGSEVVCKQHIIAQAN